jgi:hypothetical protein
MRFKRHFWCWPGERRVSAKGKRRTAYAWVYVGDLVNPYTVFDLSPGHQQEFPEKFLTGYRGFIHADGHAGYNPLYAAGATHVGCWMHVRRYFFEAKESAPARAHEAIARIRLLYAVETAAKEKHLSGAELAAYRQEHARQLLQAWRILARPAAVCQRLSRRCQDGNDQKTQCKESQEPGCPIEQLSHGFLLSIRSVLDTPRKTRCTITNLSRLSFLVG